jgi:3-phenylpropionate/cinnamic acid dioxygenase small subunit
MALARNSTQSLSAIELRQRVAQFLGLEAMLLDEGRLEDWFKLLDDEIVYEVPLRESADSRAKELPTGSYRIRDNKAMIRARLDRLATNLAHAEIPPSRTVRTVSSICLLPDPAPEVVGVSSTLIVYRHRGHDAAGDVIHARRNDRLRIVDDGARLVARTILLAETALVSTPNLGIFL